MAEPYQIEFTPSAARGLKKLDKTLQGRIVPRINALAANPRPPGSEKLAGRDDRYRIRAGDYRIIYAVADPQRRVTIAVIGHRREVYR